MSKDPNVRIRRILMLEEKLNSLAIEMDRLARECGSLDELSLYGDASIEDLNEQCAIHTKIFNLSRLMEKIEATIRDLNEPSEWEILEENLEVIS